MLLESKNLTIGYDNNTVIKNLNFKINSGDYLYILGENGSGKSTLLKTLLKLQKSISGEIVYSDEIKPNEIGYLPQQTEIQKDFPASVNEVVISGRINKMGLRPFFNDKDKTEAETVIHNLNLCPIKNNSFQELSGGQKQRVLLARALVSGNKILLLDEPISSLDPKAANDMYELIYKLNKEYSITVAMVSHDMAAARKYATHILYLNNKESYFGTKEEFLLSRQYASFKGEEE